VTAYAPHELQEASANPAIIHFVMGTEKPWQADSRHPFLSLYQGYRSRLAGVRSGFSIKDPQE
jgi:hypothetical protein